MTDTPTVPVPATADLALRAAVGLVDIALAVLERGVRGVDEQGEPFTGSELDGSNVNFDARRLTYQVGQARFVVEHLPAMIAELRLVAEREVEHPSPPSTSQR